MGRQTRKHHGSSQSKKKGHLETPGGMGVAKESGNRRQRGSGKEEPKSSIGDGVTIEER